MKPSLMAAISFFLMLSTCGGDSISPPDWAGGVSGPTVIDQSGLVSDWEYLGWPDESAEFLNRPGRYSGDFGVDANTSESTAVIVTWTALPCQEKPISRVTGNTTAIHIDVTPGPNPIEHCAAMEVRYGLRLTLAERLGNRKVTATLIDPVNQTEQQYP